MPLDSQEFISLLSNLCCLMEKSCLISGDSYWSVIMDSM